MNIYEVIIDAARETETGTPTTSTVPTLEEYIRWANRGQDIITNATDCLEQLITFSTVAEQEKYSPPANFIRPLHAEWTEATRTHYTLAYKHINEFRLLQDMSYGGGTPGYCTLFNKKFHIYPWVTSAAGATTLDGDHTATATTITVASTTNLPTRGRIIIGSEVIGYTNKTSTTLTGAERGLEGTTAATHSDTDAVTERDLSVYSSVRYLVNPHWVYNTGTAAFANADATVTGTSTVWNEYNNIRVNGEIGTGTVPTKWYTIDSITDATHLETTANWAESNVSTTNYVAASKLEIPTEFAELLTLYIIIRTKKRLELYSEAKQYEQEFYAKLRQAKIDTIDRTNIEYPSMQDTLIYDD